MTSYAFDHPCRYSVCSVMPRTHIECLVLRMRLAMLNVIRIKLAGILASFFLRSLKRSHPHPFLCSSNENSHKQGGNSWCKGATVFEEQSRWTWSKLSSKKKEVLGMLLYIYMRKGVWKWPVKERGRRKRSAPHSF